MNENENQQMIFPDAFTYSTIGFKIRLKSDAIFPKYKGSLFRGVLGKAMHDLSCRNKQRCNDCSVVVTCPYANLFKPELILENQLVTVPFVIFSNDKREFLDIDDTISLQVTLFGDFTDYMDYFVKSFQFAQTVGLGHKRAKFEIVEIRPGNKKTSNKHSLSAINSREAPVKKLSLRFLSPVSLFRDKKHIYAPVVEDIIEYLVHRVNRLNRSIWRVEGYSLHREMFNSRKITVSKYNINYSKIFKSKGLGNKVELSGFTGYMEFSGDLAMFYPLLRAGEILHIGSRTSYGLGKYELMIL